MADILSTQNKLGGPSVGHAYGILSSKIFFQFKVKAGPVKAASKIFLTIAGDSIKLLNQNDTIINYHFICKNFSLRYGENEKVDIVCTGNDQFLGRTEPIPMELLFLKRNKSVYVYILTPKDPKSHIPYDLLYNVVTAE